MNHFSPEGNRRQETIEAPLERPVLPIDAHRENILEAVTNSPSTVLVGETGSGKTTKTPLYLLEQFPDKRIAVTSPRVLPARSVSKYVASQLGERVGDTVGVVTREKRETGPDTRCLFMTDGVLLNMLRKDPALEELDIVMVDEAHERGLNVDLALGLLKRAQALRVEKGLEPLKIIVASATLEEEKFTNYFSDAPLVKVPGRMFPVEVSYHPFENNEPTRYGEREKDYTDHAADVTSSILSDPLKDGDILIFMPGEAEIMRTIDHLRKTWSEQVELLPLYGSMNPQDQDKIFAKNGKRKVIVSTNIAETSVTIDTVRHVVDAGYSKEKRYDPMTGIDTLALRDASQANMDQRKGRAGRVSSGWCYRLIDQKEFKDREAFAKPEILRSNLAEVVLKMKDMGIDDVEGFEFIDPPSKVAIHDAVRQLTLLGALDDEGNITALGKEMADLPLEPGLSRAVIEAKRLGCIELMADVVSMFSTGKQLFFRAKDDDPEALSKESRQNSLKVRGSDYLTALNVWREWVNANYSTQFAFDHLVNIKALREAGQVRDLLLKTLGDSEVTETEIENDASEKENITRCLLVSKPDSIFYGHKDGFNPWTVWSAASENAGGRSETSIFPGSSCYKVVSDLQLLIGEDVNNNGKGKTFIRRCHAMSLDDLKRIAPHLISETEEERYGGKEKVIRVNGVEIRREGIRQASSSYDPELPRSTTSLSALLAARRGGYSAYERSGYDTYRGSGYGAHQEKRLSTYEVGSLMVGNETLSQHNGRVYDLAKRYAERNRTIKLLPNNWDYRIHDDIASGEITTLEDAKNQLEKYVLSFDALVSKEQQEETDRLSPETVILGGVSVPVVYEDRYSSSFPFERVAVLTFNLQTVTEIMKDKSGVFTIDLPLVDKTVFKYTYHGPSPYSDEHIQHTKVCTTFKELAQFAITNKFEADEREKTTVASGGMSREERDKLFSSVPTDDLYSLQGGLDTKEKKEKLARRISLLRALVTFIEQHITDAPDSKTKNKVLAQLKATRKELRETSEKVESYKSIPIKVGVALSTISDCEALLGGQDVINLVGVLDKRYLGIVYANISSLKRAAEEGELELTEELANKIIKKSLDCLIGDKPLLVNPEEASDILIGELL